MTKIPRSAQGNRSEWDLSIRSGLLFDVPASPVRYIQSYIMVKRQTPFHFHSRRRVMVSWGRLSRTWSILAAQIFDPGGGAPPVRPAP
jgi:hypothetical protein